MNPKVYPSDNEVIYQSLTQRCFQNTDLFQTEEKSCYWKLSDLAILYPNFFDMNSPISAGTIQKINNNVLDHIPEFHKLTKQPVHVLNIKETYNMYIKDTNFFKTVKNRKNQQLTRVACEHLFRKIQGAEFEQAYFLFPNKNVAELTLAAHEIEFERIRDQIASSSNILSAIINRAQNSERNSFAEVWAYMWCKLYSVQNMDELRDRYNIKTSPIDYMKPRTLVYINGILQEIILHFCDRTIVSVEEIKEYAASKAAFARANFIRYGSKPEEQLLEKNSYRRIEKMRDARIKFWQENYTLSL